MRALGLMSGTSMDGIDVALIDTDGEDRLRRGPAATYAYAEASRQSARGHRRGQRCWRDRAARALAASATSSAR